MFRCWIRDDLCGFHIQVESSYFPNASCDNPWCCGSEGRVVECDVGGKVVNWAPCEQALVKGCLRGVVVLNQFGLVSFCDGAGVWAIIDK